MSEKIVRGKSQDGHDQLVDVWKRTLAGAGIELTVAGLIGALSNAGSHIRTGAAIILGRRNEVSAIPHLKSLLVDQDPVVRVEAAMSLTLMDDRSGLPILIEALDEDLLTGAPTIAAGHLASLGDPRGYPVVLQALKADLAGIRLSAAVALKSFLYYHNKMINDNRLDLFVTLKETLNDPEPLVRRELLYKLAALDDPRASEHLLAISRSDSDEDVRQTAAQLLSGMTK